MYLLDQSYDRTISAMLVGTHFCKIFYCVSVKLMVRILLTWTSWPQTAIPENVVHWLFAVAVYIEKWDHYRPHHCKFTCSNHMDTYAHENLHITNFGTNAFIELVIPILIGCCSYTLHHCIYLTEGHMTVISGPPWNTANKWLIGHCTCTWKVCMCPCILTENICKCRLVYTVLKCLASDRSMKHQNALMLSLKAIRQAVSTVRKVVKIYRVPQGTFHHSEDSNSIQKVASLRSR